jgi:hypothetical protein
LLWEAATTSSTFKDNQNAVADFREVGSRFHIDAVELMDVVQERVRR